MRIHLISALVVATTLTFVASVASVASVPSSPDETTDATIASDGDTGYEKADAPSETIDESRGFSPDDPEVRHLVTNWGYDTDQAITIADFQLVTGPLASDILANFPDEIAGVELLIGGRDEGVARDEIILEIGVAGGIGLSEPLIASIEDFEGAALRSMDVSEAAGSRTVFHERSEERGDAVRRGELDYAHARVVDVPLSRDELDRMAAAVLTEQQTSRATVLQAETDWRTGAIEVIDTGRTPSELDEWALELSNSDCHTSESQNEVQGDFKGGRLVRIDKTSDDGNCNVNGICTIGMPTTIGSTRGIFTAGHCFPSNWSSTNGVLTSWSSRDVNIRYIYDESLDYAWGAAYWRPILSTTTDVGVAIRRWSGTYANGQIWKYDEQLWRNITAYENEWRAQGYDVCHPAHGQVDNPPKKTTYCAEVVDSIVQRHGYDTGTQNFTETWWAGSTTTSIDHGPGGGSSGGPMFYGSTTYGIHVGTSGLHGDDYGIYMRWGPIHDMFQGQFGTNADFICYSSSGSWGTTCDPT